MHASAGLPRARLPARPACPVVLGVVFGDGGFRARPKASILRNPAAGGITHLRNRVAWSLGVEGACPPFRRDGPSPSRRGPGWSGRPLKASRSGRPGRRAQSNPFDVRGLGRSPRSKGEFVIGYRQAVQRLRLLSRYQGMVWTLYDLDWPEPTLRPRRRGLTGPAGRDNQSWNEVKR